MKCTISFVCQILILGNFIAQCERNVERRSKQEGNLGVFDPVNSQLEKKFSKASSQHDAHPQHMKRVSHNVDSMRHTTHRPTSNRTIYRDGHLDDLAKLLNHQKTTFVNWVDTVENYRTFIGTLDPWITSEPPIPLSTLPQKFSSSELNCQEEKYSSVLTGQKLTQARVIVDFIPFGYDIDKLEVRLQETFNIVDIFVIYESPRTQSGISKPLYFSRIKSTKRFLPYLSKLIHFNASDADIQQYTSQVKRKKGDWALEKAMRTVMVRLFAELSATASPLKAKAELGLQSAWGIQNDADELITGKVLHHVKNCEIRDGVKSIYMPCFSFKKNFHWLQETYDVTCLGKEGMKTDTKEAASFLWRAGPVMWPLRTILQQQSTLRGAAEVAPCQHHMGLGAASHMSSVAEPVEYWLKRGGVNEQTFNGAISPKLIAAGALGTITPQLIFDTAVFPWCPSGDKYHARHVSTFSKETQRLVFEALPYAVRKNPGSYPFLVPGMNGKYGTVGLFSQCGDAQWGELCGLSNASSF